MEIDNSKDLALFIERTHGQTRYSPDAFWCVYFIKRRKDPGNENIKNNSVSVPITKFIRCSAMLEKGMPEIREISKYFNARAYLSTSVYSLRKTTFSALRTIADMLEQGKDYEKILNIANHAKMIYPDRDLRTWVVDVDSKVEEKIRGVKEDIEEPDTRGKVKLIVPTVNGAHILTTPFDLLEFKVYNSDIDVHKDGLTLLYYQNQES